MLQRLQHLLGMGGFSDNKPLSFGTDKDFKIRWNSTASALTVLPVTDDAGAVYFGNGTYDADVKVFLGTTGETVLFDVGNSQVTVTVPIATTANVALTGVDTVFTLGAFSSLTSGSGTEISATNTAAARFYADLGGVAAGAMSARNLLARTLVAATQTANVSLRSLMGHIKLKNGVDFSSAGSRLSATQGYLECAGESDFAGFTQAVDASIELVGDSAVTGVLSGVRAALNVTTSKSVDQSSGVLSAFTADTDGGAADMWGSALYVNGADTLFRFSSSTSYEDGIKALTKTPTGNTTHAIKIAIGTSSGSTVTGYIPVYDDETFNADD